MDAWKYVYATVTAPWGEVSTVFAGSVETWAWEDRKALAPWLKVKRAAILSEFTCDPKAPGWRVTWRAEDEADVA